ncbi:hypothetical protein A1Q1_05037 [Trichosporon asahii var. asahii CBS 2479]|uniref:Uncharacterized protein n=1 Tax=Trichosporon asahii var. asahii (strain ATCC 90039 / CBS 2479 / JCM 2466 / KCTC 7840 / NBRC 103889/ NCYC 2677 / UAMH 7654) TaxID=1186058 RepID=J4U7Q3_TRIAS|nr:hypothetical protein A1Q1_05037 [Trichosporon asahii var. asahii CBS 2479]EJT46390.1 hypothetical protein A1Q1_05037 [Trichosporon asahii var. asahii CBS 2479]
MHTLSSSYQNNSALNIPNDHPFRASLPPRLRITADGDILSAVTDKAIRRHAAIVDGLAIQSATANLDDLIDLHDIDLRPSMRPTSVLSVTSTSSDASTSSRASVTSASTVSDNSDASRNSDASMSKLVRTLGSDPFCNLNSENSEAVNTTVTSICLSPRGVIKAIRKSRISKS